jgi:hypothetical protein
MTNPAPLGGDERTPPVPEVDPLAVSPPAAAVPPAPVDGPTEPLDPTPAYDSLAAETAAAPEPLTTPSMPLEETVLTPDADYGLVPDPGAAGPLAQVKAFAQRRPAVFLGVALLAGWLVGKTLLSSSDD